ncbi:MAG: hypothetical protein PWQ77_1059, partial [Kosmotogales bacterium]|nr:hypothetical protein [Kosmotogales bacterium]
MKRLSIILIFIIITISAVTFSATQLPGETKSFGF